MVRRSVKKAIALAAAAACTVGNLGRLSIGFLPAPCTSYCLPDEIGDAAVQLGAASYDFAKQVNWNSDIFLQPPGKFQPLEALKAIDKMIVLGAAADPVLLKKAAEAHHKAIGSIYGPNGMTSRGDWDNVNAAIGRVIASVPEEMVMDVYNAVSKITDPKVPEYMKSMVNSADAERAYEGFLTFKDVVRKNQVAAASFPIERPARSDDAIGVAAAKLSDASYPFLKQVDWLSDVYLKPLPGVSPQEALKAVDKLIVMGAAANGNALKAAAEAHHKAIQSINGKGVTSAEDYAAVNAAIGRVVASVPRFTVMDAYNTYAQQVSEAVPLNMLSKVNAQDAYAAAKAFYEFKDVVGSAQR